MQRHQTNKPESIRGLKKIPRMVNVVKSFFTKPLLVIPRAAEFSSKRYRIAKTDAFSGSLRVRTQPTASIADAVARLQKIVRLSRRVLMRKSLPKMDSRCGGSPSPYALS